MKIRNELVLLVAAVVAPIVLLAALNTASLWKLQRQVQEQRFQERVNALRLALDTEIAATVRTLQGLSDSPDIDAVERRPALQNRFEKLLSAWPAWQSIVYVGADETVLVRVDRDPAATGDRLDRATANELARTRSAVVSGLVDAGGGRFLTYAAVPVLRAGEFAGVVYIGIPHESWMAFLRSYPISDTATLTLNDQKGLIIARTLNGERWVGKRSSSSYLDRTVNVTEGSFLSTGLEGQQFYTAFSRLRSSPWVLGSGVPEDDVEAALGSATWQLLGTLVAALVTALLMALVFSRRIATALDALARRARAVGHAGAAVSVAPLRIAEAESVRQALDHSAAEIQAREASLADAMEREKLARAEAEHASRAKDEYLSMLSHELRNPMNAIKAAAALLAGHEPAGEREERARAVIQRQTSHLAVIVDDLVDVARLNSGKVSLDAAPIDGAALVRRVVENFADTGRSGHLAVRTELGPVWLLADDTRVEQIVSNLLDNTCKYTPEGGHVTVSLAADGDMAVLRVADDGAGIPAALLPKIFDLFVQGERTIERAQGGLGLGLTVARQLAELHGGSISVQSDGIGRGATFTVRLPRAEAPAGTLPATAAQAPDGRMRIVVVDDAPDIRETTQLLLTLAGHEVKVAVDGPDGVEKILHGPCDLAVIDIGLPGFDGYEVARRVRAALGSGIALVALTGYGSEENRRTAFAAGFNRFFVKPFDADRFEETLQSARADVVAAST
jgi:signal transduction histidine kinase/ActR/RegA family two-component response regulator